MNTSPSEIEETGSPETPRGARRTRAGSGRRARWWLRTVLLVLCTPVITGAILAVLLIGREITAPSWIVRDVETRATQVLAGGALDFGAMRVRIGRDLHPELLVRRVVLRDADGAVLARVPQIRALISPRGVVQGRVLPQEVRLSGAQISLRRARDGTVALAFDNDAVAIGAADGFLGVLDQINRAFAQGALEALEQVRAEGLIINYVDARAGRSWVVDSGRVALDLRGGQMDLRANVALLSGRSFVSTAELTYRSPRDSRSADIGLAISDAAAADIASQSPQLAWLGVLRAPISGSVRGRLDDRGALISTSATLQIGAGELRPTATTTPIPFHSAQTYLNYDPQAQRLVFDLVEVDSDWGRVTGTGQTYLRDFREGRPETLLGQLQFAEVALKDDGLFDASVEDPVELRDASVDFRLRLDPFTLDIGQAVAMSGETPLRMDGQVRAAPQGWSVALDAGTAVIDAQRVLALWPKGVAVGTKAWLGANLMSGTLRDAVIAFRKAPGADPATAVSLEFEGARVKILKELPPIEDGSGTLSIVDRRVALRLDGGQMTPEAGGPMDLAGSTFVVPQSRPKEAPARIDLAMEGEITAAMSLLMRPPFNLLAESDLPVDFTQGRARISAGIDTPLGPGISPERRRWSATADLRAVRSDALVPGRTLSAQTLQLQVDQSALRIAGPVSLGELEATATFTRALGAGPLGNGTQDSPRIEANVTIDATFLDTFNISLPRGAVRGASPARLTLDLEDPAAPGFRLTSDLRGMALDLAALNWSKARETQAELVVAGQLGAQVRIDELTLDAPGLQARGTVALARGGGFERATFERVRLGGWLDAPVTLIGRGAGLPVAVDITGGTLDLRAANFGVGRGASAGGDDAGDGPAGVGAQSGPIEIALETLQVSERIALRDFRGQFSGVQTAGGGLQGVFGGALNGAASVQGRMVATPQGSAVQISSADAGSVLRATGLMRSAFGGTMQLSLTPTGAAGTYDGLITGADVAVREAPALANLLDAISVGGLVNQLEGQGIAFSDVSARFRLTPNQIILTQSSAVGPGLGISLDGIFSLASQSMDFQGVISPFFLINGIGSVLTRPGEGLIGFNFNLRGPVDSPSVLVNPLSALTPGMFRDIFRRPPPTLGQ